ncbi:VRR-NUC domain-containing protein [Labrys neptuniae]
MGFHLGRLVQPLEFSREAQVMIVYGTKAPRRAPEEHLQKAIIVAVSRLAPKVFVAHIPNGGGRSKTEAVRLKAAGVKRGVPDLLVILSNGDVGFIEVKAGKAKLRPEQDDFANMCVLRGTKWAMVNDLDQVKPLLEAWGEIPGKAPRIEGAAT